VLRVIARMNAGGPAYHVSLLGGLMDPSRFETLLVTGNVGPGEASLADLADELGVSRRHVGSLGPKLDARADVRALADLVRIVRGFRPHVVHTHTAKAGMLGRLAALSARPRPVIVHTYHGHVLEGYFGPLASRGFRALERLLGLVSDRLIGVSEATVDDLVRLRVAPRERFEVIPLGLRLDPFLSIGAQTGSAVRTELGIAPDRVLLTAVGRLVPIKRLDVLITAMAELRSRGITPTLAIVGDGELRATLEDLGRELGVADTVRFLGHRRDLVDIVTATDIAVLTSDNEGTPVALIEAAAGGRPLVATDVGGVSEVVVPGAGRLVAPGDAAGLADAIEELAGSKELRQRLGASAREHVRMRYQAERLVDDIERLYDRLTLDRDGVGARSL
jgi:glycosyltransferase involved in cell wall biosynthesis